MKTLIIFSFLIFCISVYSQNIIDQLKSVSSRNTYLYSWWKCNNLKKLEFFNPAMRDIITTSK